MNLYFSKRKIQTIIVTIVGILSIHQTAKAQTQSAIPSVPASCQAVYNKILSANGMSRARPVFDKSTNGRVSHVNLFDRSNMAGYNGERRFITYRTIPAQNGLPESFEVEVTNRAFKGAETQPTGQLSETTTIKFNTDYDCKIQSGLKAKELWTMEKGRLVIAGQNGHEFNSQTIRTRLLFNLNI
jgi:hypothetical protein